MSAVTIQPRFPMIQAQMPGVGGAAATLPVASAQVASAGVSVDRYEKSASQTTKNIAQDPRFKRWLSTTDHPHAHLVKVLAERLSWEQVRWIDRNNGFEHVPPMTGCIHACRGCDTGTEFVSRATHTSWEEYTDRIKALTGLGSALKAITGRTYDFFRGRVGYIRLDYQNDPMATVLRTRDGEHRTIRDVAQFVFNKTGKEIHIITSGWNPRNAAMEDAARGIVHDMMCGDARYLVAMDMNIKMSSRFFIGEVERFMSAVLKKDRVFQRKFGAEYRRHGMDFSHYRDYYGVSAAYRRLVIKNIERLLDSSQYMQDRIENLKTLLPAILAGKIVLHLYDSDGRGPSPVDELMHSYRTIEVIEYLRKKVSPVLFNMKVGMIEAWDWSMPPVLRQSWRSRVEEGLLVLHPAGFLKKTRVSEKGCSNVVGGDRVLQNLLHSAVFCMEGPVKPRWQMAGEEFLPVSDPQLSAEVRESIESHIRTAHLKSLAQGKERTPVVVNTAAEFREVEGKSTPAVRVKLGSKARWFNLLDGTFF